MEGFSLLGNVSPDDVVQGHLDDCYFLSVLSVLAERPHMIRSLFLVQEANPHGAYAIKLCRQGIWTTVTLDDYFPCWVHDGPVFSKVRSGVLVKGYSSLSMNKSFSYYFLYPSSLAFAVEEQLSVANAP